MLCGDSLRGQQFTVSAFTCMLFPQHDIVDLGFSSTTAICYQGFTREQFCPRCLMYRLDEWSVIMHYDIMIGPTLVFMISINVLNSSTVDKIMGIEGLKEPKRTRFGKQDGR